jgi:2-polyprenyl-3-methyl-5-hydroxy-6-metoxy-1,4-benzoquinol methylase
MNTKELYEHYHVGKKLQKRIINKGNFTDRNLIPFIDRYFKKMYVMDIGCGVGTISFYLASKGFEVTGIDISPRAVRLARRNAKILNLANMPKFLNSSFMNLKVKRKYDCIFLSEVLEHLPDDNIAIKKIFSMLKNGGVLIASSPSENAPLYKWGLLKNFDSEVGHLRRYNQKQFIETFEKNGFKVIKVKLAEGIIRNTLFTNKIANFFVRFIRGPIADFVTFIDNSTIPILGESDIILVAKKK